MNNHYQEELQSILKGAMLQFCQYHRDNPEVNLGDEEMDFAIASMKDVVSDLFAGVVAYKSKFPDDKIKEIGLRAMYSKFLADKNNPPISFESWKAKGEATKENKIASRSNGEDFLTALNAVTYSALIHEGMYSHV